MTKKAFKTKPAGKDEKVNLTYAGFASNLERTELKTTEGKEFDNDELLKLLGFKEDENGLKLSTANYDFEIADNGEIIRKAKDGKVLTGEKELAAVSER